MAMASLGPETHFEITCILHYFDDDLRDPKIQRRLYGSTWRECHCSMNSFQHHLRIPKNMADTPLAQFFSHVCWEAIDWCENNYGLEPSEGSGDDLAYFRKDGADLALLFVTQIWKDRHSWLEEWHHVPENLTGRKEFLDAVYNGMLEYYHEKEAEAWQHRDQTVQNGLTDQLEWTSFEPCVKTRMRKKLEKMMARLTEQNMLWEKREMERQVEVLTDQLENANLGHESSGLVNAFSNQMQISNNGLGQDENCHSVPPAGINARRNAVGNRSMAFGIQPEHGNNY